MIDAETQSFRSEAIGVGKGLPSEGHLHSAFGSRNSVARASSEPMCRFFRVGRVVPAFSGFNSETLPLRIEPAVLSALHLCDSAGECPCQFVQRDDLIRTSCTTLLVLSDRRPFVVIPFGRCVQ